MRRSISYAEPKIALAGECNTWKFIYTPATDLAAGARLKFDLASQGRDFDWEIPQVNTKTKQNLIWMETSNGKVISAKEVYLAKYGAPQFEFLLPKGAKGGEPITISIGTPNAKESKEKGTRAQHHTMRRRCFYLDIDPKGKGDYKEKEIFHLDIQGNVLHAIRIVAPSVVVKNQRFDVVVRFEDQYGNLTNKAPENTLIEFSYAKLRENINWKLFVPETGFINLPNLYFNEEDIYQIQLKNLTTQDVFYSDPIKCVAMPHPQLIWGAFHNESILWDAGEHIESCLRHNRDEKAIQFFASSSFEDESETPQEIWKTIGAHIAEFNEDDRFTTFLGFQWSGTNETEGLRQLVYTKDHKSLLRKKDTKSNNLKKIYKSHTPKDMISIPSFTMSSKTPFNFEHFTPEYEKVVEIYNAWGSSECTKSEGNPRPIQSESRKGVHEVKEGSIRRALNANHRFGFVAGGYDDRGIYKELFDQKQKQYSPGMTGIYAESQSRDGLIQAINQRRCYATTGPRIILGFYIANQPMGSELNTKTRPGLAFNRHINAFVIGTTHLKEILLIRGGKVLKTYTPQGSHFEIELDDTELLEKVAFHHKKENGSFTYYYLRAMQQDSHLAWSSPIWIDLISPSVEKKKT